MTINTQALFDAWAAAERAAHSVIAPLQTEQDYEAALETLEQVWEVKAERPELETLLGLLVDRIHAYEEQHDPMPDVPPGQLLGFLMEQHGRSQTALSQATGIDQTNLSRLIKGERDFTTTHVRTLARHFKVSPNVFL